jgi:hypothetical protein
VIVGTVLSLIIRRIKIEKITIHLLDPIAGITSMGLPNWALDGRWNAQFQVIE